MLCALVLALALFAYVAAGLFPRHQKQRWIAALAVLVVMLAVICQVNGFDGKTLSLFALSAGACTAPGLVGWRMGRKTGRWVVLVGGVALAVMGPLGPRFLDLYLYLALAALFLWLFMRQAQEVARERAERLREAERARDLSIAIARAETSRDPPMLEVSLGSRTEFVAADAIRSLSGAGDYVEARWGDARSGLLSESLAHLEELLSPSFIRAHRSHLVNSALVIAIERDPSGTGRLILDDGSEIPVSRRLMPRIGRSLG